MKRIIILITALLIGAIVTAEANRRRSGASRNVAASPTSPTPDILWWKLNEGSGTSITGDGTNGGDDGTTDADWTTGIAGGSALSFNGSNDDALTSASITYGTNRLTFSFWINANPTSGGMLFESSANLNSNDNCFYCYKAGAATIQLSAKNGGTRAETFTIATNQNLHVLVAWDGSTSAGDWVVWTNGVECTATSVDINSRSSTSAMGAYTLYVGARGGSSLFYNRPLDDFRIYSGTNRLADLSAIYGDPQ